MFNHLIVIVVSMIVGPFQMKSAAAANQKIHTVIADMHRQIGKIADVKQRSIKTLPLGTQDMSARGVKVEKSPIINNK